MQENIHEHAEPIIHYGSGLTMGLCVGAAVGAGLGRRDGRVQFYQ